MSKLEWFLSGILIVLGSICLFVSATSNPGQSHVLVSTWFIPLCILLCLIFGIVGMIYILAKWNRKQ